MNSCYLIIRKLSINSFRILLLFVGLAGLSAESFKLVLNSGHIGKVEQVTYDEKNGILFTSGEDGTVRLWDTENHVLLKKIRVSYLPIKMLALNSYRNIFAVFETNDFSIFRVSVWNWKTGKMLYEHKLRNKPLYMAFSSKGNYLAFSMATWKSLIVLNADTGNVLPLMNTGFGIVSFFVFSNSEDTLLTYQPSGKLSYWKLKTGHNIKNINTIPNLSQITISSDKSFIAGKYGDKLLLIDALTGLILDSTKCSNIKNISISPGDNELSCTAVGEGGLELYRYALIDKELYNISILQEPKLNIAVYGNNALFLGFIDGVVSTIKGDGSRFIVGENQLEKIYDIAFDSGKMILVTDTDIITLDSDYFSKAVETETEPVRYLKIHEFDNPFGENIRLVPVSQDNLVVWTDKAIEKPMIFFNIDNGGYTYSNQKFNAPLTFVGESDRWILTVDDSGTCNLIDKLDRTIFYTYKAPGMHKLIITNDGSIVGAKSKLNSYDSALLWINPVTGETFPISDDSLYVYELGYDRVRNILYTIGVQKESGEIATILKKRDGSVFENQRILFKLTGEEDVNASIAINNETGTVYTSLGYLTVKGLNGNGGEEKRMEENSAVVRKLIYHNGKLYALNRDSSISIWNAVTGELLLNYYLLKNGEWVGVVKRNSNEDIGFVSSRAGAEYLNVIFNDRLIKNLIDRYKLRLETEIEN